MNRQICALSMINIESTKDSSDFGPNAHMSVIHCQRIWYSRKQTAAQQRRRTRTTPLHKRRRDDKKKHNITYSTSSVQMQTHVKHSHRHHSHCVTKYVCMFCTRVAMSLLSLLVTIVSLATTTTQSHDGMTSSSACEKERWSKYYGSDGKRKRDGRRRRRRAKKGKKNFRWEFGLAGARVRIFFGICLTRISSAPWRMAAPRWVGNVKRCKSKWYIREILRITEICV